MQLRGLSVGEEVLAELTREAQRPCGVEDALGGREACVRCHRARLLVSRRRLGLVCEAEGGFAEHVPPPLRTLLAM